MMPATATLAAVASVAAAITAPRNIVV